MLSISPVASALAAVLLLLSTHCYSYPFLEMEIFKRKYSKEI